MTKDILRIGGRDPDDKLRGIAVNKDGYLMIDGVTASKRESNINESLPLNKLTEYTGVTVLNLTYDGVAYCGSNILEKTTDFIDFEQIHTFDKTIDYAFKLQNGSIFVVLVNGDIWLSDVDEGNFVLKTDELGGQGHPGNTSRASVYNNILLVGEYATPGTLGNRIFISTDYGKSFRISLLPEQSDRIDHIHSVVYDPYEQLIWVAAGDQPEAKRIFWSRDFGKTWETHDRLPYRMTTIIPMPDTIIFGLDDPNMLAMYKYTRVKGGPTREGFLLDLDFIMVDSPDSGTFGWTSQPSINHIGKPYAYVGTRISQLLSNGDLAKTGIYKTNGEEYLSLWESKPDDGKAPYGIRSVHGPDKAGRVMATMQNNHVDEGYSSTTMVFE